MNLAQVGRNAVDNHRKRLFIVGLLAYILTPGSPLAMILLMIPLFIVGEFIAFICRRCSVRT